MKKLLRLIFVFIVSFVFVEAARAASVPDWCDTKINTETYYHESGWDTYVYVCNSQFTGRYKFSTCDADAQVAKDFCEGTFSQSQYKGSYQTAETGECNEEKIESCFKCTVECYKPNGSYYECSASDGYSYTEGTGKNKKYFCASYSWQAADPITYSNDTDPLGPDDKGTYVEKVKVDKCGGYQSRNAKCEDQYRAKVPIYKCVNPPKKHHVKNMREAKYTVTTAHGTTIPAYCVNPGDEAPSNYGVNNVFVPEEFENFDPTACVSSSVTPDCGYSNILIEGYYRGTLKGNSKYNYAVIGAAMRLWGAHWGAAGYYDTGIADEDDSTINDPNKWLKFVPQENGQYLNVFKATVASIMEQEFYRPSTDDIYDVNTDFNASMNLQQIACSSDRMGLFCGEGNKDGYIYALALYVNTVQGNKYMKDHLNEIHASIYGDEIFTQVTPVGAVFEIIDEETISVTYTLQEGVEVTCDKLDPTSENANKCRTSQKLVIETINGEIVKDIDSYDYCDKNYCKVVIKVVPGSVICDILEGVDIKITKKKTCGANSVKKYYSCVSMTGTQIMYSFEPDPFCEDGTDDEYTPWIDIRCDNNVKCPDTPKATTPNCNINSTSQSYVSREVADPSLNCILHKNSDSNGNNQNVDKRNYYDYSEMFGVNQKFCKVYCSDKVTYYMAGREDVYSALQLKYDIESKVFPSRPNSEKSSHAITSIINVQRDCVSEIYYDNINFSLADEVGKNYGLSENVNDWKQLYEALTEKSMTENNRQEVLNQIIYDLYTCNFFSDSQINSKTGGKVKKPKDSKSTISIAKTILNNTQNYCNDNDCVIGKIQYKGGAEYITPNTYRYTGLNWSDPALSTEENVYDGLNLRYCDYGECFRGEISGSFKEDYASAHTSRFNDTVRLNGSNVTVPTNDYAIFTFTMEADLYNSTRYQTEPYSGKVKVVENNVYDDTLQTLDKYLYPISKSAKTVCSESSDGTYLCDVNYDINVSVITEYNRLLNAEKDQIGTIAFRRKNNGVSTDLIALLNNPDTRKYSCVYGVKPTSDKGFVFRNIDLNNPVPVDRDGTKLDNSNWDVNNPDSEYSSFISGVINEIKTSGQEDLYATDEYLEYSYELTPDAILSIRNHNINVDYYEDVIPGSCTLSDGKNFNCKSVFLQDLHAGRFGVTLKKIDGNSKFNHCKENPSEEECVD